MPLFEYRCEKCKHQFERLLRHQECDIQPVCPVCEHQACEKLISRSSFSLRGDGWARDGYATPTKE